MQFLGNTKEAKIFFFRDKGGCPTYSKQQKVHRDVAQLVAHYVRDVGVGRSSRLIPTKKDDK